MDTKKNSLQKRLPALEKLINLALLGPNLDENELRKACELSVYFSFAGLCTNLTQVPAARKCLENNGKTKLIAAISFPFGAIPTELKVAETEWAAAHGAERIDLVPNFYDLQNGNTTRFGEEVSRICSIGLPVRLILNMSFLKDEHLKTAVETAIEAGVQSLQNGNGFGPGVNPSDIRQLSQLVRGRCGIQAVGGINTLAQAIELIDAGASTIGTSKGELIMNELRHYLK